MGLTGTHNRNAAALESPLLPVDIDPRFSRNNEIDFFVCSVFVSADRTAGRNDSVIDKVDQRFKVGSI